MANQLIVQFEYSAEDHAAALAEAPHLEVANKWWNVGGIVVTVLVILAGFFAVDKPLSVRSSLLLLGLLAPIPLSWWAMPSIERRLQILRFRRSRMNEDLSEVRAFGTEGFLPSAVWPRPIPWGLITSVAETANYFLISHAGAADPEYVPKRSLSNEQITEIREILSREFRSREQHLRLLSGAT